MIDLDRIEALANAATPGPWTSREGIVRSFAEVAFCSESFAVGEGRVQSIKPTEAVANAAFIAAARTDVPALVAELRAARAEIDRLRTHYATLDAAATALDCAPCEVATVAARLRERATRAERRTAADERADVVAWLSEAPHLRAIARDITQGAHIGAAKGGERG